MDKLDKYHGLGGTYVVVDGKRERVDGQRTITHPTTGEAIVIEGVSPKSHPDGDRARDKDGKAIVDRAPEAKPAPQPDAASGKTPNNKRAS